MRFIPNGNRILVAPDIESETQKGLIIPRGIQTKSYETGLVVEVGSGRTFDNGKVVPTGFKPGQRVAYLSAGQIEMEGLEGLDQKCVLLVVPQVLGHIEEKSSGSVLVP
jgi:co-chaperonin GroES (HSP10)